jgi:hypothetical protein
MAKQWQAPVLDLIKTSACSVMERQLLKVHMHRFVILSKEKNSSDSNA